MLFIFDWDGTLCDSTATITTAMQSAAADLGWDVLPDSTIHEIIGLGLPEALRRLYPKMGDQQLEQLRDAYAHRFVELDQLRPSAFFDGVRHTLDTLRAEGHILTVATGKSRRGLDRIFAAMDLVDYFHSSRCADETASKPNPLMLNQLLDEFGQSPSAAVMVGDTEYDMDMAKRIAMPRIAVSYGAHHISRLQAYEPELCLDDFAGLLKWQGLGSR